MLVTPVILSKESAYARERQIKNWKSRKKIKELIEKGSEHPDFNREGTVEF